MGEEEDIQATRTLFKERKENIFSAVTALCDHFKNLTNKSDFYNATAKLERSNELYEEYRMLEREIILFNASVGGEDPIAYKDTSTNLQDMRDVIRMKYLKLKDMQPAATQSASQLSTPQTSPQTSSPPVIQVASPFRPSVNIPKFSGIIRDWNNFYALFDSVIHNTTKISKVEKFQYLRSYLTGDALTVIENYDLTEANYEIAYNALKDRYSNPRVLANNHLNSLFTYKGLINSNHAGIQAYLNVHLDSIQSFKKLKIVDHYDYILFQVCYSHLDKRLMREFDKKYPVSTFPKYDDLMTFIKAQLQSMELHYVDTTARNAQERSLTQRVGNRSTVNLVGQTDRSGNSSSRPKCFACPEFHPLYTCTKFKAMPVAERHALVKSNRACFNCFGMHPKPGCPSEKRCKTCVTRMHHTLLHFTDRNRSMLTAELAPPSTTPHNEINSSSAHVNANGAIDNRHLSNLINHVRNVEDNTWSLLGTAILFVRNYRQEIIPIRAIIDSGAMASCITKDCVDRIAMPIRPEALIMRGLGNSKIEILGSVALELFPSIAATNSYFTNAVVLDKITGKHPQIDVSPAIKARFLRYRLADPSFYFKRKVDMLIGADLYPDILEDKPIVRGNPSGIHTVFGLIIIGNVPDVSVGISKTICTATYEDDLDQTLKLFWETEEVESQVVINQEDEICETLFKNTVRRTAEGRYIVALPLKSIIINLSVNTEVAKKRLFSVERKFIENPTLKNEYSQFMNEYLNLGHMQLATMPATYVIPHHAVFKESTTTKLRVVFDASNRVNSGQSLNEVLYTGPKLQKDINLVLTGFRTYKVALCADLEKMYRQILVREEDRKYQHIYWRENNASPISEYELNTVTYGLGPSSFLAQRVLKQLVLDEGDSYQAASEAITHDTFVDDITSGAESDSAALTLYHELKSLLNKGGFKPRKWRSSSPAVLNHIPFEDREPVNSMSIDIIENHSFKILGIKWNPELDVFFYTTTPFAQAFTKRGILKYVAGMYDPLGWIAPFIFSCKYFIQKLWLSGYGWDQTLNQELQNEWVHLTNHIDNLSKIKIPRYLQCKNADKITIVGFCDASQRGYASVLYVRTQINDDVNVMLVAAKTKVAPIKTITIPRLELNAAYLMTKLYKSMENFFRRAFKNYEIIFYSDSQIVLTWLNTLPYKLKTYVANRVIPILDTTSPRQWHHIPTALNIADIASRGATPRELAQLDVWVEGPQFLRQPNLNPDQFSFSPIPFQELPESRNILIVEAKPSESFDLLNFLEKKNLSFLKTIRILAY